MSRWLSIIGVGVTMTTALTLYAVKLDTRALALHVASLEQQIERTEAAIGLLTAERAHLARSSRIEPLARQHLGLQPMQPEQLASVADVPWREEVERYRRQQAARQLLSGRAVDSGEEPNAEVLAARGRGAVRFDADGNR